MKPIKFEGFDCTYAKDQDEYLDLPAYKHNDDVGTVTSCWRMSVRERLKALFTGRIYLSLLTFGKPLNPQILEVDNPVAGGKNEG